MPKVPQIAFIALKCFTIVMLISVVYYYKGLGYPGKHFSFSGNGT